MFSVSFVCLLPSVGILSANREFKTKVVEKLIIIPPLVTG